MGLLYCYISALITNYSAYLIFHLYFRLLCQRRGTYLFHLDYTSKHSSSQSTIPVSSSTHEHHNFWCSHHFLPCTVFYSAGSNFSNTGNYIFNSHNIEINCMVFQAVKRFDDGNEEGCIYFVRLSLILNIIGIVVGTIMAVIIIIIYSFYS